MPQAPLVDLSPDEVDLSNLHLQVCTYPKRGKRGTMAFTAAIICSEFFFFRSAEISFTLIPLIVSISFLFFFG